jgi:2-aminoadipate transaminase
MRGDSIANGQAAISTDRPRLYSAAMAPDTISFARGAPSADILPVAAVREAAARTLESDWQRALSYGTGRGHPGLCEWIAELHGVSPDQVMVTNGSLEAGAMLFWFLLQRDDQVVVEQPSYDRTLLLLERLGVERIGVPLEADGVDVEAVAEVSAGRDIRLVHVIPNHHNPAGCTLSAEKRLRLVGLAHDRGFNLFEDDPYRLICFEKKAGETMLAMDEADRVIHASSFSKTVAPGVRVGYLVGPAGEISALSRHANETYISPNMLAESVVWELCRSGELDRSVEIVNAALRERRDAVVAALREQIPEAEFVVPGGGYFLWLTLKRDVDTTSLLAEAKQEGVSFIAGPDFMLEGGSNALRLSFASVPPDQIPEGIARIARALERVRTSAAAV